MHSTIHILSKREQQVAKQIALGKTNRDIGDSLFISERTVKFHCANIYKKLKIANRTTLISRYADQIRQLH
jgi:DNA-binding NarL/FixJ family response regulator